MAERSAGEAMTNRRLTQEKRAGVPHYVSGQHSALIEEVDGQRAATISYVDVLGHAVVVLLAEDEEGWVPMMTGRAGVRTFGGWRTVENFELSDKMKAALAQAESDFEKRRGAP